MAKDTQHGQISNDWQESFWGVSSRSSDVRNRKLGSLRSRSLMWRRDLAERRSHPGNALLKDLALGAATSQHPRLRLACSPVPP